MSENTLTDEQLMAQVMTGEAAALETLYDRYSPAVMGLALRITGDQALAEEAVQETFWRIWRRATTYQAERGAFSSWLFGIARNLCLDLLRRRRARPQPLLTDDDERRVEQAPDQQVDVAEAAWTSLQYQQVRVALEGLPAPQRQVIELAYFRGLTRQEIARATGEPLGTIHTRARLGLQKLRELLQPLSIE
jgi:RNA polymerase sigma-70 factor (ECF subfamily)